MPTVKTDKKIEAYKSIGEATKVIGVPASVLRFWEKEFKQIKPYKSKGRRHYLQKDFDVILKVKELLYDRGYTLEGARNHLKEGSKSPNSSISKADIKSIIKQLKSARAELSKILG